MLHLLLIGGDEIGAPKEDGSFRPLETLEIDQHFISTIGKKSPNILFIPTATEVLDPKHLYEQGIQSLYGDKLGCKVETLYLSDNPSIDSIKEKLLKTDALYIGGGDTAFMMKCWQKTGFDKLLRLTALQGKPIAGLSAGAMCWFDKVVIKENGISKFMTGIGLLDNFCIPHWNKKKNFAQESIAKNTQFIGIDECAALEINGKKISIIRSNKTAEIYKCSCCPNLQEVRLSQFNSNKLIEKKSFSR